MAGVDDDDFVVRAMNLEVLFAEFFNIPAYQRSYEWPERKALSLIDDLLKAFKGKQDKQKVRHVLGMIVVSPMAKPPATHSDVEEMLDLTDGQQRLTTLSLLLAALRLMAVRMKATAGRGVSLSSEHAERLEEALIFLESSLFHHVEGRRPARTPRLAVQRSAGDADDYAEFMKAEPADPRDLPTSGPLFKNFHAVCARLQGAGGETTLIPIPGAPRTRSTNQAPSTHGGQASMGAFQRQGGVDLDSFLDFVHFMRRDVKVIQVRCPDDGTALQLFDVCNRPGQALDIHHWLKHAIYRKLVEFGEGYTAFCASFQSVFERHLGELAREELPYYARAACCIYLGSMAEWLGSRDDGSSDGGPQHELRNIPVVQAVRRMVSDTTGAECIKLATVYHEVIRAAAGTARMSVRKGQSGNTVTPGGPPDYAMWCLAHLLHCGADLRDCGAEVRAWYPAAFAILLGYGDVLPFKGDRSKLVVSSSTIATHSTRGIFKDETRAVTRLLREVEVCMLEWLLGPRGSEAQGVFVARMDKFIQLAHQKSDARGSTSVADASVRQALLDRLGGPLYEASGLRAVAARHVVMRAEHLTRHASAKEHNRRVEYDVMLPFNDKSSQSGWTVEHVYSQSTSGSGADADMPPFLHHLGNLAPLESILNSKAKNSAFVRKKEAYAGQSREGGGGGSGEGSSLVPTHEPSKFTLINRIQALEHFRFTEFKDRHETMLRLFCDELSEGTPYRLSLPVLTTLTAHVGDEAELQSVHAAPAPDPDDALIRLTESQLPALPDDEDVIPDSERAAGMNLAQSSAGTAAEQTGGSGVAGVEPSGRASAKRTGAKRVRAPVPAEWHTRDVLHQAALQGMANAYADVLGVSAPKQDCRAGPLGSWLCPGCELMDPRAPKVQVHMQDEHMADQWFRDVDAQREAVPPPVQGSWPRWKSLRMYLKQFNAAAAGDEGEGALYRSSLTPPLSQLGEAAGGQEVAEVGGMDMDGDSTVAQGSAALTPTRRQRAAAHPAQLATGGLSAAAGGEHGAAVRQTHEWKGAGYHSPAAPPPGVPPAQSPADAPSPDLEQGSVAVRRFGQFEAACAAGSTRVGVVKSPPRPPSLPQQRGGDFAVSGSSLDVESLPGASTVDFDFVASQPAGPLPARGMDVSADAGRVGRQEAGILTSWNRISSGLSEHDTLRYRYFTTRCAATGRVVQREGGPAKGIRCADPACSSAVVVYSHHGAWVDHIFDVHAADKPPEWRYMERIHLSRPGLVDDVKLKEFIPRPKVAKPSGARGGGAAVQDEAQAPLPSVDAPPAAGAPATASEERGGGGRAGGGGHAVSPSPARVGDAAEDATQPLACHLGDDVMSEDDSGAVMPLGGHSLGSAAAAAAATRRRARETAPPCPDDTDSEGESAAGSGKRARVEG